jgi:hypothetical protein
MNKIIFSIIIISVLVLFTPLAFADTPTAHSATVTYDVSIGEVVLTWDFGEHDERERCILKTDVKLVHSSDNPATSTSTTNVDTYFLGTNSDTLLDGSSGGFSALLKNNATITISCTGSLTYNIPSGFHLDNLELYATFAELIKDEYVSTHNGTSTLADTIDTYSPTNLYHLNTLHGITIYYNDYGASYPLQCGGNHLFEIGTEYFKDINTEDTIIELRVKEVCNQNSNGSSRDEDGNISRVTTTVDGELPTTGITTLVYPSIEDDTKNNGGCADCTVPTFFKNTLGSKIVKDGFSWNRNSTDVTGYHTPYDLIIVNVNETNTFTMKAYENHGVNNFKWFKIGFGIPEIGVPTSEAEVLLHVKMDRDQIDVMP